MKKIIYICYMPLYENIERDYYFQDIINNGFEFEYWDITALYYKNISFKNTIQKDYVHKINSFSELKELLKKTDKKNKLFIPQMSYEWKVLKLFRLLTKYKCKIAFYGRAAIPLFSVKTTFANIFSIKIINKILFNIFRIITVGSRFLGYVKCYDYIFCAGSQGIYTVGYGSFLDKKKSETIQINSFDYDNYLAIKNNDSKLINSKYCVFLDEYIPYHPDYKMLDIKTVDPENYFNSLNNCFDYIEKTMHLKVIIAAHPKSDYKINPFNNRQIFKLKTNELVKDSEFVLGHDSCSLSYAVLYKRPILLLVNNEIINKLQGYFYPSILTFQKNLNTILINCDCIDKNLFNHLDYDNEKYEEYKYNYLTSKESEAQFSKDIVINFLNNL